MQTLPLSSSGEALAHQSPVQIWQILLAYLLNQHYGLTLNDTPFQDDAVIQSHIDAGISLCDAVNFIVEKYELVRTDRSGFTAMEQSPLITAMDILRARRATGMVTRSDHRIITDVTTDKSPWGPSDESLPEC